MPKKKRKHGKIQNIYINLHMDKKNYHPELAIIKLKYPNPEVPIDHNIELFSNYRAGSYNSISL